MRVALVGVNKYKIGNDLRGCVNDVLITRQLALDNYKVPNGQIRMLTDERAQAMEITDRLEWLVAESFVHTKLLFHFSGHGTYVPNVDYALDDPEFDGMDEVICPYNFTWEDDWSWIKDDAIYSIIAKKNPKAKLVMIFDCCHSGTVFRNIKPMDVYKSDSKIANALVTGMAEIPRKIRSIPTPVDLLSRVPEYRNVLLTTSEDELHAARPTKVVMPKVRTRSILDIPNVVVISGCADHQTSADAYLGHDWHGALSYYLQMILCSTPDIALPDLEHKVKEALRKGRFSQNPQFSYGPDTDLSKLL